VIEQHLLDQQFTANIAEVRRNLARAAQRVGRKPEEITLVGVSKTKPLEQIQAAYRQGLLEFGENRVQEALPKIAEFHPSDIRWHLIGHLQTNKVGKVVGMFSCIHSVDSLHLAEMLNQHAAKVGVRQPILLQVNISGEVSKEGVHVAEAVDLARQIIGLTHVEVQGLMTVAPLVTDEEETRPIFRALRELRDRLRQEVPESAWQHLSMGMTNDYRVAVEEGATIVRVGRAIFGERPKKERHDET
jgi:pyridoxal phosphate enzyme (YggS family)